MIKISSGYAQIALAVILGFAISFGILAKPPSFLPRDHGRAFAVAGEKSKGKIRGVGLLFICAYILIALLFLPFSFEFAGYLALLFFSMLFGYLDDASEKPWSDYLKGALDFGISILAMFLFLWHNPSDIYFFGKSLTLPPALYFVLGIVLIWVSVNVVNCSDGVDGLCGSVSAISFLSFAMLIWGIARRIWEEEIIGEALQENFPLGPSFSGEDAYLLLGACLLFISVLLAYLWFNISPSSQLMGDAGSRAIGFFLAIIAMKSGHPWAFVPFCLVMILDGGLGLVKIFLLRFFKISLFKNIRMPLHDHFRKALGWSDTQVVGRYIILQILISAAAMGMVFHFA